MTQNSILDVSSLAKALDSLDEAINKYKINSDNSFVRDASIHRFEYSYELAHKLLKRYLELSEPNAAEIDRMPFPEMIRTASERGLVLNGWDVWKLYRDARNITSHTYNESKAIYVCTIIPGFLKDAKYLLSMLQQRIHAL